jgi:hypothetical protein
LKGYRLWVIGQLDSTCRAPPWAPARWTRCSPPPWRRRRTSRPIRKKNVEARRSPHRRKGERQFADAILDTSLTSQVATSRRQVRRTSRRQSRRQVRHTYQLVTAPHLVRQQGLLRRVLARFAPLELRQVAVVVALRRGAAPPGVGLVVTRCAGGHQLVRVTAVIKVHDGALHAESS